MTRGRWLAAALAAAAALVLARALAVAFVEYRWFAAFGPAWVDVWRARAVDLAVVRSLAALVAGVFLYLNLLGVASTIDAVAVSRRLGGIEIAETVPAGRLRGVFALASVAFGLAMALPISDWVSVDALLTGRIFGEIEPYTGRDLAFFVYWLPFENGMYAWSLVAVAFVTGAVVALYALTPGLRWARGRVRATVRVRRHLALFGVATLLLLAWGHRLDAYALLTDGSGVNGAFAGTDELALLPTRFGLAIVSALAAVVVLRAGWAGQARLAFWAVSAVVAVTILGRSVAGPVGAALIAPERLDRANKAAAENRALYTRRAFASNQVRDSASPLGALPSARDVVLNAAAWDAGALARASALSPDPRAPHTVVGWQPFGDSIAAVVAGPRGGAEPGAIGALTAGAADRTVARGGWRAIVVDPRLPGPVGVAPRAARGPSAPVDVAGVIYPGAGEAAVVRDPTGQIVGDSFRTWIVRLAAALAARDLRLLRADDTERGDVRLVRWRDPRARVQALLPFFAVGRDASPIVVGDSLWWAVPVLATTAEYPLSAHLGADAADGDDIASLRHAGTAVVNAATGNVRLVAPPEPDADIRGWYARFPRIATRADALDSTLVGALPVPYEAALAQARVYAEYGPRGTHPLPVRRVQLAELVDSAPASPAGAAFVLRVGSGPHVVASAFPVITGTDRIAGAVVASGGPVPRTAFLAAPEPGPRWADVLDSTSTTVADGGGPRTRAPGSFDGGLHAVPSAGGLIFTRAHYAAAADTRPSLTGVTAVLSGGGPVERVLHGPTLVALFDTAGTASRGPVALPGSLTAEQRVVAARSFYDDARRALERGDWGAFGHALDAIGRMLGSAP